MKKAPERCQSMREIRAEIDRLGRRVIAAWAERYAYVRAAARFKADEAEVAAPERFRAMPGRRRRRAEEGGLDPDVVEGVYRNLVRYFVSEEERHWRNRPAR